MIDIAHTNIPKIIVIENTPKEIISFLSFYPNSSKLNSFTFGLITPQFSYTYYLISGVKENIPIVNMTKNTKITINEYKMKKRTLFFILIVAKKRGK